MKSKITTIFFDLGEVLLTNDWSFPNKGKDKEFEDYYRIDNFSYVHNPYFEDIMTGKISEKEFWVNALKFFKAKTSDPSEAIKIQRKYQQAKPGMFTLLKNLQHNNYRLGVISTIHRELLDWKIEKYNLTTYFTTILSSGYFGKKKPDPAIYYEALQQMQVIPQESIFVDDSKRNVEAAEKIGMQEICFNGDEGSDKLRLLLQEKGVFL